MKKSIKIPLITLAIILGLFVIGTFIALKPISVAIYEYNFALRFSSYEPYTWKISDFENLFQEKHIFQSNKGQNLVGYKYYGQNPETKGIVVLAHGFGTGGHRSYLNYINYFVKNGYEVFSYDATGNDESEGEVVGGLPQGIIDLDYALRYVKSNPEFKNLPIFLWGHSWGGYSVGSVVKLHPDVKAACVVAGFNSSIDMLNFEGRKIAGNAVDFLLPILEKHEKKLFGEYASMSILESTEVAAIPTMFIHSTDDDTIPIQQSYDRFYEKFSSNKNNVFIRYETRGHSYICCSDESKNYRDYYSKQLVEYSKEFEEVTEEMWEAYNFENFDKHQAFQVDEDLMSKILEFYNSFNY